MHINKIEILIFFFRNLNSDDAKRIVSDPTLGLKKKEIKFILDFHTFTSKQK
jgi:hypothetical protein